MINNNLTHVRCPCYGQLPSDSNPLGTPCLNVPPAGQKLCSFHLEMFDAIDRVSTMGITGDMDQDGLDE